MQPEAIVALLDELSPRITPNSLPDVLAVLQRVTQIGDRARDDTGATRIPGGAGWLLALLDAIHVLRDAGLPLMELETDVVPADLTPKLLATIDAIIEQIGQALHSAAQRPGRHPDLDRALPLAAGSVQTAVMIRRQWPDEPVPASEQT